MIWVKRLTRERVTLDYATSSTYLSHLDPFSINQSSAAAGQLGLSIPLPTAISAFVVRHRGSANFFDLLERVEVWRTVQRFGVGVVEDMDMGGAEGMRVLGGVPS